MSNRQLDPAADSTPRDSNPWLRRAWTAVALVPLFFFIAFAVGEGIYALMGYKPESAEAPGWAVIVASALVLLVALIPSVAAVHFGRRAIKLGDRRGVLPAVLGAVVGVGWVVLTIVTEVGNALRT